MEQQQKTNTLAIISLIMGLISVPLGWITCALPNIAAIILGILAQNQIKRDGSKGAGLAKTGVILGALGLVILIGVIILSWSEIGSFINTITHFETGV